MDLQAGLLGRKCVNILPSPPESPSMYAYPPALGGHGRYTTRLASRHVLPTPSRCATFRLAESDQQACDEKVSASQSQENPSRDGRTPPHSSSLHQIITAEKSDSVSSSMRASELPSPDEVSDHLRKQDLPKQRPTRASSTASHHTPQLLLTEAEHQSEGDELFTGSEEDDITGGMKVVKSGAERLAEKRKMKRFRLTHAQTRYLMSEFSRQAHPDAAQRERLSRDIPGLNPRQVQVWFQNRRAKLKRLTTDDQERMRRSRALPEDFDFSQTLQPSFREGRPSYGSALTEPLMFGAVGMGQRPSLRLGTGHLNMASSSMDSIANNALTPVSATGSANPSPASSIDEGSERSGTYFSATQSPLITSPQYTNPFGHSHSLSVGAPAFQRQGRPSNENSMMGIGGQSIANGSPSNPSVANNTFGYGNLPPLHFTKTPFQTRDGQRFGRFQGTEGLSHENSVAMNQHYISPSSSPNALSCDQSQMLYPSGSGYRASSYYQSPDPNIWQGSPTSPQAYQYGQNLHPHQTTEQRRGGQSSPNSHSQHPSVSRYDQRSYSHSGEHYRKMSLSNQEMSTESDAQAQPRFLGEEAAPGLDGQPAPDASRPRARSDTFPAYYNAQQ